MLSLGSLNAKEPDLWNCDPEIEPDKASWTNQVFEIPSPFGTKARTSPGTIRGPPP